MRTSYRKSSTGRGRPNEIEMAKAPLQDKINILESDLRNVTQSIPDKVAQAEAPLKENIANLQIKLKDTKSRIPDEIEMARAPLNDKIKDLEGELRSVTNSIPKKVMQAEGFRPIAGTRSTEPRFPLCDSCHQTARYAFQPDPAGRGSG